MPISPEKRALYPADWQAISLRIRERDGQRCKRCGVPNRQVVYRSTDNAIFILDDGDTRDAETGEHLTFTRGSELPAGRFVAIVLTVAHLDHDPGNNADDNLAALCQLHHLRHDQDEHRASAADSRRRRARERGQGELFGGRS